MSDYVILVTNPRTKRGIAVGAFSMARTARKAGEAIERASADALDVRIAPLIRTRASAREVLEWLEP